MYIPVIDWYDTFGLTGNFSTNVRKRELGNLLQQAVNFT
jgi:hypothetical protein